MNPALLLIIINLVILGVMAIGFFRGTVGLKYTMVRFIFFLLSLGVTLIIMDKVAETLASSKFIGGMSISDLFVKLISKSDFFAKMYDTSPRLKSVIDQLPSVIFQALSFTLTLLICMFCSNIIYGFLKKFVLKNIEWFDVGKQKNNNENKEVKKGVSARSRFFGGMMGMVFAFCVLVAMMLPITGILKTFSEILEVKTVYAEETLEENKILLGEKLFGDNYENIQKCINVYKHSSIGYVSGIGNMDKEFVKKISTVKIDGKNVNLLDSVENMSSIYEDILYVVNFSNSFTDISDIDNFKIEKVKNIINYFFDNELFDSLFDEIFVYSFDYIKQNVNMQEDTKAFLNKIYDEMKNAEAPKTFVKTELFAGLDICQILIDSKIVTNVVDLFSNKENKTQNINDMIEKLLVKDENNTSKITYAVKKLKDSKTLNITTCFIVNKVLSSLENSIIARLPQDNLVAGFLGRIDLNTAVDFDKLGIIADNGLRLWQEISVFDFKSENLVYDVLTTKNSSNQQILLVATEKLETILNDLLSLNILNYDCGNESTIFDNLCYYFNRAEMFDIINYEFLTEENIIHNEITLIKNTLNLFYNSSNYQTICNDSFDKKLLTSEFIKFLDTKNGTDKNIKYVCDYLLSTKLFRNTEKLGLNLIFENVNNAIKGYLPNDRQISNLNYENMYSTQEKNKISAFAESVVNFYNVASTNEKGIQYGIINSDYQTLGSILEDMRDIEIFDDTLQNDGYYTSLMLYLHESLKTYLNLDVAVEDSFDWKTNMQLYGNYLNSFLNYEISDGENTYIMFDIFVGTTNIEIGEALSQMGAPKILYYYTNLKDCKLFKSLSQLLIENYNLLDPSNPIGIFANII